MAKKKNKKIIKNEAYVYDLNPETVDGKPVDNEVRQSSPAWVLTFVRWQTRDTLRTIAANPQDVRDPLVVENDCLQVTTSDNKGTLTTSMNAVLIITDVNYETLVAPGDFVFVNILNWESESRRVANAARASLPINGFKDGFKGLFKIQGVRKIVTVDPGSGVKVVLLKINGFSFTEFNNSIYFNPSLLDATGQDQRNALIFASLISEDWASLVNEKGFHSCQDIISMLIQSFVGAGIQSKGFLNQKGMLNTPNVHFRMPSLVGKLLGLPEVKAAKDIFRYLFGIQQYNSSQNSSVSSGLNPKIGKRPWPGFYYTTQTCGGSSILKPEYWNQVKAWSILNQYTNSPLNELYTCFRVSPEGSVLPTLVFRQIPFTNDDFPEKLTATYFMNIPRWKIDSAMVFTQDLGRDESARFNFVQYFGRSNGLGKPGIDLAFENAQGNYVYDVADVQRSGLKPFIISTEFEDPSVASKTYYQSPGWAKIIGDALIGGHLKFSGTIECIGIMEPIVIGDNLQYDDSVYHIEQISHMATINAQTGIKTFRTNISVSYGIDTLSNSSGTRYNQMDNTNAYEERSEDSFGEQILPGVSEEQDVVYRKDIDRVWPTDKDIKMKNSPFPQPNNKSWKK